MSIGRGRGEWRRERVGEALRLQLRRERRRQQRRAPATVLGAVVSEADVVVLLAVTAGLAPWLRTAPQRTPSSISTSTS